MITGKQNIMLNQFINLKTVFFDLNEIIEIQENSKAINKSIHKNRASPIAFIPFSKIIDGIVY